MPLLFYQPSVYSRSCHLDEGAYNVHFLHKHHLHFLCPSLGTRLDVSGSFLLLA